jgi:lipopolysaccharide/colanic/teichoic acid biosynthesis glycosyltransferase
MTHPDAKRFFDIVVGSLLLLIAIPTILVCAVGTAISLRCWPFFTQRRIGRDGQTFLFVKLRTLPLHTPRYANKYQLLELHIPRFSLALRRLHLDELPQLFLVLLGKMSLVGPRPEMPNLADQFDSEFARQRTGVRPGCTGLWQISEHCAQMIYEHPEYDAHYLRNRSLRFDLWIMTNTVRIFLPWGNRRLASLTTLPAWAALERPTPRPAAQLPTRAALERPTVRPAAPSLVESRVHATDVRQLERAMQVVEA